MINVLKFSMGHEYKHAWNFSARTCNYIHEHLEDCMVLYRYKLVGGSSIYCSSKYGVVDPVNIDFSKINGKSIFLYHLDVYKKSTHLFKDLLDYCLLNNIDIYISMPNHWQTHIGEIQEILKQYDVNYYDLNGSWSYNRVVSIDDLISDITKNLIRDIKMNRLLD